MFSFVKKFLNPKNKLRIRNIENNPIGETNRILHANFTILCEYAEKNDLNTYTNSVISDETSRKIYDLYQWYTKINWKNPIPLTDEHRRLQSKVKYEFIKDKSGNFQIKKIGSNLDIRYLEQEQERWLVKKTEFTNHCRDNLLQLCSISHLFWN